MTVALDRDGYPKLCLLCGRTVKVAEEAVFYTDVRTQEKTTKHISCWTPRKLNLAQQGLGI